MLEWYLRMRQRFSFWRRQPTWPTLVGYFMVTVRLHRTEAQALIDLLHRMQFPDWKEAAEEEKERRAMTAARTSLYLALYRLGFQPSLYPPPSLASHAKWVRDVLIERERNA